jgi:hypothetical protein
MDEHESATEPEQNAQETVDSPSLKEKISKINFRKWGTRAAVVSAALIVAGVVVGVTRNKTETEE